jgi:uncharacterized protein Yka (UPF0111/DUF47 family)
MKTAVGFEQGAIEKRVFEAPFSKLRKVVSKFRVFPKSHDFFDYFRRSGENVVSGTALLCEMIKNQEGRAAQLERLKEYEHIGDKITHDVIDLLHTTFLTPFDRLDIHKLIVRMDDVLDLAYYVGNRLTRYRVTKMPDEMAPLAHIVHLSAIELSKAIVDLKDMKNSHKILNRCIEVNRLENEADELMNTAIENLFSKGWDPCDLIKHKELLENLETAVDKCEDVANIIESIILRNA